MDQLHWGIIGSVEKAKAFIADTEFTNHPHQLTALLTIDDNVDAIEGVDRYTTLHDFLKSGIEAVYIASPYAMHYAQVRQCLLHHIAVLCERPLANNTEELSHLIHVSQLNHTFMMEAMWIRFLPSIKKILSIVSSGIIGDVISVKASVGYKAREATVFDNKRNLFELGIYPIFLCTLLLGQPQYIQANGAVAKEDNAEAFTAFLSYENGQFGFVDVNRKVQTLPLAQISGDKGTILIKNPWSAKPEGIEVDLKDGTKVVHKSEWQGQGLHFEMDEVYASLQQGLIESQLYCHNFSLDVMETLDEIQEQLFQ